MSCIVAALISYNHLTLKISIRWRCCREDHIRLVRISSIQTRPLALKIQALNLSLCALSHPFEINLWIEM